MKIRKNSKKKKTKTKKKKKNVVLESLELNLWILLQPLHFQYFTLQHK